MFTSSLNVRAAASAPESTDFPVPLPDRTVEPCRRRSHVGTLARTLSEGCGGGRPGCEARAQSITDHSRNRQDRRRRPLEMASSDTAENPARSIAPVEELAVEVGELLAASGDPLATRRELASLLLQRAARPDPPHAPRLPGEVAEAFLRAFSGETQAAYARDLALWFVWLDGHGRLPFDVTRVVVDTFAAQPLPNGARAAASTTARRLAALAGFYSYAADEGLVERNPVARVKRPRVSDKSSTLGISKARARRLIQAARHEGARELLLVLLLLHLGLRVSEAVGADVEDLGEEQGFPVLFIAGKGESEKRTAVPLNAALQSAIAAVRVGGREQGPLLQTQTGRRLTRQQAGKIIKRLGQQIGLPDLYPHALRHSFVTLALNEGASLRDVQDAARHADPRTTRRYDRDRNNLARHPTHRLLGALDA